MQKNTGAHCSKCAYLSLPFALKTRERELRAQDFVTREKKKRGVSQIERHLSFLLCLRKRIFLPFDTLLLSRE